MGVSVPLVRKRRGNPAMVVRAMEIVATGGQRAAAGRILGSSLNRSRQSTAAQTVQATKTNHNGAKIAATNGRQMIGNAMMANGTVFVATTR